MELLDPTVILLAFMGALFLGAGGILLGRALDPKWRVRQFRRFLKTNHVILYLVSKDSKNIFPKVINADEDAITWKGNLWVIENNRIWREAPAEFANGKKIAERSKLDGFNFNPSEGQSAIRHEEGTPIILVDSDHIKPIRFAEEPTNVTPSGAGSSLNSWVINQIAKGLVGANKNLNLFLIIIALIALVGVLLSYQAQANAGECKDLVKTMCVQVLPEGQKIVNNTLIITGGTSPGGGG